MTDTHCTNAVKDRLDVLEIVVAIRKGIAGQPMCPAPGQPSSSNLADAPLLRQFSPPPKVSSTHPSCPCSGVPVLSKYKLSWT